MKYLIELSFLGTNYYGWQKQLAQPTVQAELNKSLSVFFRENISTVGCGRTDTGVHAICFYAHFELDSAINDFKDVKYHLNAILPPDIAIKNINLVPDDFHARYSAISRTYSYLITKNKNPILMDRAWFYDKTINTQLIKDNLSTLIGIHDFSAFAKKMPINNYNCNIYDAKIMDHKDYIIFSITANRFLRQMVRSIVGVLISIGTNVAEENLLNELLLHKDRSKIKIIAPPQGLYLTRVTYPE
ncbi:MAG: tRNA pseudouridine38-40 synthase [Rikenellaceae bacterium]|nr:tRNA pseudouridine38-40 synthase [Rikenellaceae bacterium]